jgi:hypothetical protein
MSDGINELEVKVKDLEAKAVKNVGYKTEYKTKKIELNRQAQYSRKITCVSLD